MKQTKIVQVQTHDNYSLDVKIDYPVNSESVIIFVMAAVLIPTIITERLQEKNSIILICLLMNLVNGILLFAVGTREAAEYQMFLRILCL